MRLIPKFVAECLIRQAKRTPYTHIYDGSGSLYMERFWLFGMSYDSWFTKLTGLSVRLHYICRPDNDRHFHDHPWNFVSVILRGGYVENRPPVNYKMSGHISKVEQEYGKKPDLYIATDREGCAGMGRAPDRNSFCYRRATDRHLISWVSTEVECWTLFVSGPKRQWWGFYVLSLDSLTGRSRRWKIHHSDYAEYLGKEGHSVR